MKAKPSSPIALVTGASSGIGKELAGIHAGNGGDLVLVARREDKLNELKAELENKHRIRVTVIAKDLTAPGAARETFEAVQADGLSIDYLINNAGFGGQGKFHERDWQEDQAMIQLNILALSELCHLFLPAMVKRNAGRILNVSSTASLPPGGPLQTVYFATKHYVSAFSYGLAGELHDSAVTVTALLPGATETGFAATASMESAGLFENSASARSVAEDGYKGMLEGKLRVISGMNFGQRLMMKLLPLLPVKMVLGQVRKMQEID